MEDPPTDVVVVGAGAAGLLAAAFAARAGARVTVLEAAQRPGAKIRISGGGRCNVLPSRARLEDFWTTGSARALRNIVMSWPLPEVRAYFENGLGIPLADEAGGKVFPRSGSSRQVADALLTDCARAGAVLRAGCRVAEVRPLTEGFAVRTADGDELRTPRLVIATGGLSLPKTGSDGAGYRFARALGHDVRPTRPALVPLLAADPEWAELAGVSLPVAARVEREGRSVEACAGDFLFTHRGFSGPVILDLSRHFTGPESSPARLRISWAGLDAAAWDTVLRSDGRDRHVSALLRERLPDRLAGRLLARAGIPQDARTSRLPREPRKRLVRELADAVLGIAGDEGYRTAEVTGGGVPLAEVRPRTLESRLRPGLHFAGEVLDATGRLGGFNFLWAWVTGRTAGLGAAAGLGGRPAR